MHDRGILSMFQQTEGHILVSAKHFQLKGWQNELFQQMHMTFMGNRGYILWILKVCLNQLWIQPYIYQS